MKRITAVSNGWLAERFQLGAVTGVSPLLHRFQAAGGTRTRAFKAVMAGYVS